MRMILSFGKDDYNRSAEKVAEGTGLLMLPPFGNPVLPEQGNRAVFRKKHCSSMDLFPRVAGRKFSSGKSFRARDVVYSYFKKRENWRMTMRFEILRRTRREEKRRYLLLVCALSLLCFSQAALAQSGRRQSKSVSTTPPPATETKTEDEAKPPGVKPPPVATLTVGGDSMSSSFDIPTGYLDIAINACIDRLEKSAGLEVSSAGSNLSRKDAIEKAKKQNVAHVVWLEIKIEDSGVSQPVMTIQYTVFTPETGKVKTFGRVFLDRSQVSRGPVGVGIPPSVTRRMPLDYLMREGGRQVADRVMDAFHVTAK